MYKHLLACLLCLFSLPGIAQVTPAEGALLTYRIVGFSFPMAVKGFKYEVEIARGTCHEERIFKESLLKKADITSGKAIVEVPEFGAHYTWRIKTTDHGRTSLSDYYHFSTVTDERVDSTRYRMRVVKTATKFKNAFVFCDADKVLYDMNGKPVWFLEGLNRKPASFYAVRDLKLSPFGTITLLANDMPYEINYNGDLLWQAPATSTVSGDTIEHFHHEFTRLHSGHYMIEGMQQIPWKWTVGADNDSILVAEPKTKISEVGGNKGYVIMPFGTLIEYDEKGNVVWSWHAFDYYQKTEGPKYKKIKAMLDAHENAFYFDEANKVVYANFKGNSEILKIKYPTGEVLAAYGEGFGPNPDFDGTQMFCEQHGLKITDQGNICLFNNNVCNPGIPPSLAVFKQTNKNGVPALSKVWEYSYPLYANSDLKMPGTSAGNIIPLPGQAYFASVCLPYGNMYIVDQTKKLLWDATLEKFEPGMNNWKDNAQYRASIIYSDRDFERMVWK